jgi:hypothetical protein
MKIKNFVLSCWLLSMMVIASFSVVATEIDAVVRPYVGFDLQYRRMDFQTGKGDKLISIYHPQGNIYGGLMFNDSFGVEIGHESTSTKTTHNTLMSGESASAAPVARIFSPTVYKGKSRIKGPHVNLVMFYPTDDYNLKLFGSVGLSIVKANFDRTLVSLRDINVGDVRTFSKRKSLIRLSVGAEYLINDSLSSRFSMGWVNTGNMQVWPNDGKYPQANHMIKPKDSITFGVGLRNSF